jgi:hypothetical protein
VIYNVSPNTSWEVYRVADDPAETHDRARRVRELCPDPRQTSSAGTTAQQIPAGAGEALLATRPVLATPLDARSATARRLLAATRRRRSSRASAVEITWTWRGPRR